MISAVSPAMTGINYNYRKLYPQIHTKSYNNQTNLQNPSFGSSRKLTIATLFLAAIAGFFVPDAIKATSSTWTKWSENSQIREARKICSEVSGIDNISAKCAFPCEMMTNEKLKTLFSDKDQIAQRVLRNCSLEALASLKDSPKKL